MQTCVYCGYETDGVVELEHSEQECSEDRTTMTDDELRVLESYAENAPTEDTAFRLQMALKDAVQELRRLRRSIGLCEVNPAHGPAAMEIPVYLGNDIFVRVRICQMCNTTTPYREVRQAVIRQFTAQD